LINAVIYCYQYRYTILSFNIPEDHNDFQVIFNKAER